MGNGPDGLIMSQARDRAAIDNFEDASFGSGCGISGLIEQAPHVTVALRRPVTVVYACTLVGIARDFQKGFRTGAKQEIVEDFLVL